MELAFGNQETLGDVGGVAFDATQLSREEAAAADPRAAPPRRRHEPRAHPVLLAGAACAAVSAAVPALAATRRKRLTPPEAAAAALAGAVLGLVPVLLAHGRVTPLRRPRDDDGNVLVPAG